MNIFFVILGVGKFPKHLESLGLFSQQIHSFSLIQTDRFALLFA